jgi:hypothetical protein
MAVTLNETLKVVRDDMGKAIILDLLRQSPLLRFIPIVTVSTPTVKATRWQTLPQAGTRKIGGAYTESTGTLEQIEDPWFAYGGDFGVDRLLLKLNTVQDPLTLQAKMKVAAIAARINYDFIRNDHASGDPDGFEGLQKRVSNQPSRMTIDLSVAGDSLKVLASVTNEQTFLDGLHEALKKLDVSGADGMMDANVAFFMNETTWLGIRKVLIRAGQLSTAQDSYARTFTMFGPAKLIDVGLRGDQTTEIITNTEDPGDGGNDATSIYAVRFGGVTRRSAKGEILTHDDDGLKMIQLSGTSLEPYDLPEPGPGSAPIISRRVEWAIGLTQSGKYSIARIKGFKMAAS